VQNVALGLRPRDILRTLWKKFELEKALGERRYLCQGKAILQVASPSSLCQQFPYAPFNAMVTKISKWSRIQDSCRITPKI